MDAAETVHVTRYPHAVQEIRKHWKKMNKRLEAYGLRANDVPWFKQNPPKIGEVGRLNFSSNEWHKLGYDKSVIKEDSGPHQK